MTSTMWWSERKNLEKFSLKKNLQKSWKCNFEQLRKKFLIFFLLKKIQWIEIGQIPLRQLKSTQAKLRCKTFPVCGIRKSLVWSVFTFTFRWNSGWLRCKLWVWDPLIGAHARNKKWYYIKIHCVVHTSGLLWAIDTRPCVCRCQI